MSNCKQRVVGSTQGQGQNVVLQRKETTDDDAVSDFALVSIDTDQAFVGTIWIHGRIPGSSDELLVRKFDVTMTQDYTPGADGFGQTRFQNDRAEGVGNVVGAAVLPNDATIVTDGDRVGLDPNLSNLDAFLIRNPASSIISARVTGIAATTVEWNFFVSGWAFSST